jgi:hypothetical protein
MWNELDSPPDRATGKREGFFRLFKPIPHGDSLSVSAVPATMENQCDHTKPSPFEDTKFPSSRNKNLVRIDPVWTLYMRGVKCSVMKCGSVDSTAIPPRTWRLSDGR